MKNKRRRPIFVLAIMACIAASNCIRLIDRYPVRPIMIVSLLSVGLLFGALIFATVQAVKAKNEEQKTS
jgi:hypothetical protein